MTDPVSALSRQQARDIDRQAIDEYGLTGLVLMENAGRGCAELLGRLGITGPVCIGTGTGNNGGDGYVIARHLANVGHTVRVVSAVQSAVFIYCVLVPRAFGVCPPEVPGHDGVAGFAAAHYAAPCW